MMPGHWEWVIVFLIVLLIFGGKKIPEIAKGLGKGIREFKSAQKNLENPDSEETRKEGSQDSYESKKSETNDNKNS